MGRESDEEEFENGLIKQDPWRDELLWRNETLRSEETGR